MDGDEIRRSRLRSVLGNPGADPSGASLPGDYELLRKIGAGGMGVVWLARDVRLDRLVAVKVLAPHLTIADEAVWRFGQEAAATARLRHPSIVGVFGAGELDGQRFIAMEYVDGVPLDRVLASFAGRRPQDVSDTEVQAIVRAELSVGPYADREFAPWTEASPRHAGWIGRIAVWARQAADALSHAHTHGVVHRDVKPSNLIVDRSGTVRIVDFGLARIEEAAPVTRTGALLGTIVYMAPEALAGRPDEVDARADVYSLGATIFELAALRPPYVSASLSELVSEVNLSEAPPVARFHPGVPRDFAAIVARCLARDRRDRYSTARDLVEDLDRFLAGEPVRAREPGTWRRLRAWGRRNPRSALAAAIGLAAVVAAGPAWAWNARRAALAEAAALRGDGIAHIATAAAARSKLEETEREYQALLASAGPAPAGSVSFPAAEKRLADEKARRRRARAQALAAAKFALERAAAIEDANGGESEAGRRARVDLAVIHLEDARAARDAESVSTWRDYALAACGTSFGPPAALANVGTVTFDVSPASASVFVFRYRSHDEVAAPEPVVPRLVPVPEPTGGTAAAGGDVATIRPGDMCLVVDDVEPGGVLATAGIEPGDLVLAADDVPLQEGAWIVASVPGGPADRRGVGPWDRVNAVDPLPVTTWFGWRELDVPKATGGRRIVLGREALYAERGESFEKTLGITVGGPDDLSAAVPRRDVRLTVRTMAGTRTVVLPAGRSAGAGLSLTTCPLDCTGANRTGPQSSLRLDAGSCVALLRAPGCEPLRVPFVVHAGATTRVRVALHPTGTTPRGWIRVPDFEVEPGELVTGWLEDDPSTPAPPLRLPEFIIARQELDLGSWFEFLNDPANRPRIVEAIRTGRRPPYVPRAIVTEEYDMDVGDDGVLRPVQNPRVPVYGISGMDVVDFLAWKNRRLREAGSAWLWDRPTPQQWVRAARGADLRRYTWGDRYYHRLCVNGLWPAHGVPGLFPHDEPRDESPLGVWDMCGSVAEWCRDAQLRGGDWSVSVPQDFRIDRALGVMELSVSLRFGFRPVLVPNPDAPRR